MGIWGIKAEKLGQKLSGEPERIERMVQDGGPKDNHGISSTM